MTSGTCEGSAIGGRLRLMMNVILTVHVAGGVTALLSMFVPLLARKGGLLHRRAGWVFVAGMAIVSVTSLILGADRFIRNPWDGAQTNALFLSYLGVFTGNLVWTGVRVLQFKDRTAPHRGLLEVALPAFAVVAGVAMGIYGQVADEPLLVAFAIVGTLSGAGQLAYWFSSPGEPMHWWFAHMYLMLGGCIAAVTAFVVNNVGRIGLPGDTVLIWIAPTLCGLPIGIAWTRHYRRRFRIATTKTAASRVAAAALLVILFAAVPAESQVFDVVSIKRNPSGTTQQSVNVQPTGVTFINFQLRAILQLAYGIPQPARLIGIPDWVNERYDVIARTASPVSPATIIAMRPMLQAMFADRFRLSAQLEKRELPAYALVLARSDGRLGPQLRRSTVVCAARGPSPSDAQRPADQALVQCGPRAGGPGRFIFVGSPLSLFAGVLSLPMGRTVVDRTGLEGLYDLDVTFAPEGPVAAPSDAPSLFTALQEQLGLKLDPEKELVEVLLVDRIERPTEN